LSVEKKREKDKLLPESLAGDRKDPHDEDIQTEKVESKKVSFTDSLRSGRKGKGQGEMRVGGWTQMIKGEVHIRTGRRKVDGKGGTYSQ